MSTNNQFLNQVEEFHNTFNHPVIESPTIAENRIDLRIALLQEELDELQKALKENNKIETLDALCDLQYVLSGAVLEFGFKNVFENAFDEVHKSNMSKACENKEEAEATLEFYKNKDNTEAYIVEKNNKFFVYRKSDDKTLKSINYKKVNLEKFVD